MPVVCISVHVALVRGNTAISASWSECTGCDSSALMCNSAVMSTSCRRLHHHHYVLSISPRFFFNPFTCRNVPAELHVYLCMHVNAYHILGLSFLMAFAKTSSSDFSFGNLQLAGFHCPAVCIVVICSRGFICDRPQRRQTRLQSKIVKQNN